MNILYTGAFRFPDQDAAAFRVYSVALLFERSGCRVSFAGWERKCAKSDHYVYRGHDCYPQSEFREATTLGLVGRIKGFFARGLKTLRWLASREDFDVVVVYNPPALFSVLLLLHCKRRKLHLILDNTEWYESSHLPGGRFGLASFENFIRMRVVYPRYKNVICISSFLSRYYAGRNVLKILPLIDVTAFNESGIKKPQIKSGISFIYAGETGKKDRLLAFIGALPLMSGLLQIPIKLHLAGVEERTLDTLLMESGLSPAIYAPFVECYGRVSRSKVVELYCESHFALLFRENKRYAWAGFPTKAMESWYFGCPIITNRVGDIGNLGESSVDMLLMEEDEIAVLLPPMLKKIIEDDSYLHMSARCRTKARELFHPDVYTRDFELFLQKTQGGHVHYRSER